MLARRLTPGRARAIVSKANALQRGGDRLSSATTLPSLRWCLERAPRLAGRRGALAFGSIARPGRPRQRPVMPAARIRARSARPVAPYWQSCNDSPPNEDRPRVGGIQTAAAARGGAAASIPASFPAPALSPVNGLSPSRGVRSSGPAIPFLRGAETRASPRQCPRASRWAPLFPPLFTPRRLPPRSELAAELCRPVRPF